ncbi:competence type IV pilus assembly protein ComGB [Ornithinibacillus scapharcae]|uniref:competence type IV pilus assembly protein ComGB n=1 Tax=Ornithinibacillus scapharcae TaxID=1147159 RepID=UPI000225B0F0|nr:competence type IV pilus assembly protein ComGB [Ornithinibacillus scapharcae]
MALFQRLRMKIWNKQLKPSLQLTLLKRLARALSNGYTLLSALETLKWDNQLRPIAIDAINLLKNGHPIDHVFEKLQFHPIISTYLYFAKEYGDLEESILKCVDIYEKRIEYTKKFTQVIRYPIILISIFSILFFFIQYSVLPNLLNLLQQSNQDTPFLTAALTLTTTIYYTFIVLVSCLLIMRWIWIVSRNKIPIESQLYFIKLIPFYRDYIRLNTSFLFSTHVSSLLKTGLSIKDVLAILARQHKLPILTHYANILTDGLTKGFPLHSLMDQLGLINPQLASIFQKNIDAETLEKDLSIYASYLTDEMNQNVQKAITYIQPIFFTGLGFVIILIYMSLMLPMYQFIETL